jgi:hypothetical protein
VLIVDPSADNRQVLATALDREGIDILQARGWETARQLWQERSPQLVVADETTFEPAVFPQHRLGTDDEPTWIVLGSFRAPAQHLPVHVVPKPYHYAPLIRRILALLEGADA